MFTTHVVTLLWVISPRRWYCVPQRSTEFPQVVGKKYRRANDRQARRVEVENSAEADQDLEFGQSDFLFVSPRHLTLGYHNFKINIGS